MGHKRDLWILFGRNRRGPYLVLSEVGEKNARRIFIPADAEGQRWWLFMVAAFELADRKVVNPSSLNRKTKKEGEVEKGRMNQKGSWWPCINCPHCAMAIHFSEDGGVNRNYAVALNASEYQYSRVGQKDPVNCVGWGRQAT